jgi:predicted DNA-binding ribbon-helix-helix protein
MASEGDISPEMQHVAPAIAAGTMEIVRPWEQRILQLDGRRYSLRLEHEFWAALEAIAAGRKLRLNRLVADIAARRSADGNLSSGLRVFCLRELERATAARSLAIDGAGIAALIEAAPAPGAVLGADQIVLAANPAFLRWSGAKRELLLRQKLAAHFRFADASRFDRLWSRPMREESTRIVGVTPGRVLAAEVSLVPVQIARGRRLCVLWVHA